MFYRLQISVIRGRRASFAPLCNSTFTSKAPGFQRHAFSSTIFRMTSAIPIIACGRSPVVAASIKELLTPEIEVVHVILTKENGITDIPRILSGDDLSEAFKDNIGTRDYSKTIAAVVFGAGYDDAAVKEMRDALKDGKQVPWLRPDLNVPRPPLGPEYGKAMVERIKRKIKQLVDEGKLEGDDIILY